MPGQNIEANCGGMELIVVPGALSGLDGQSGAGRPSALRMPFLPTAPVKIRAESEEVAAVVDFSRQNFLAPR